MTDLESLVFQERLDGNSYRDLSAKFGRSPETCRQIVLAQERQVVGQVVFDLLAAAKAELTGAEAVWPTLLVPHQDQRDWQAAHNLLQLIIDRLRAQGAQIAVQTRPTKNGVAHQLRLDLGSATSS